MRDFGELAEIAPFEPDAYGVVKINIDGVAVAFMERDAGTFVTWAEVGALPDEGGDRLCRRMMAESLLGIATGGAALTLDAETGKVMIHRTDPLEGLDLKGFVERLNSFLDERAKWEKALAGDFGATESEKPDDGSLPLQDGMVFV